MTEFTTRAPARLSQPSPDPFGRIYSNSPTRPFREQILSKCGVCHYLRHAYPPCDAWGLRLLRCYAPGMETYHVLAAGTVLWLLASAGSTDSHLPAILTASLTGALLLFSRILRRRRQKLQ
jgi:hypothetical protein